MRRLSIVAVAVFAITVPLRAQTVVVGVGGELSTLLGDQVHVPAYVDMRGAPGEKLGSYTVRLSWDPTILWYAGVSAGPFADPVVGTDSTGFGVLYASAISVAGSDSVFTLFELELGYWTSGTSPIDLQVTELSGVSPTFTDLLATTTVNTVSGTFCEALGRWGDLDADGFANSRDALAILTDVVQLPVSAAFDLTLGDVDGDGQVNSRDALILLSYAVGIDISGQRVLLVVPGACGTGTTPLIHVFPDTADLVVGQSVRMHALVSDSAGNASLAAGVNWQTADPRVAVVDTGGVLTVRDSGTTTVKAALGPGITATATVVGRLRRPVWYVDAATATRQTVQMGTQQWPFSTPEHAFPLLSEGDTVMIAPGVHDYADTTFVDLTVGATFIGDTAGGGPRPVLRAREADGASAFPWSGGQHGEVRNLVIRGFYAGVEAYGLKSLVTDNVRIEAPRTTWGYGVYVGSLADTITLQQTELIGDTASSYYGLYVGGGATLVNVHDSRIVEWGYEGIYAYDVDSLDVLRSEVSLNQSEGVYAWASSRPSISVRLSQSRLEQNRWDALYVGGGARTVALDHNFIYPVDGDAIYVRGATDPLGAAAGVTMTMLGDSIKFRADDYNWIWVTNMDSVAIDSLWYENPADTAMWQYGRIDANVLTLTNSQLLNLWEEGIDFSGRRLVVDNTTFTGCQNPVDCDWFDVWAIDATAGNDSGPAVTLTNSTFWNVYYALNATRTQDSAGPMFIQNNVVDSAYYGFDINGDSLVITDNVMTRVGLRAIETDRSGTNKPPELAEIARNQVACVLTGSTTYGILHLNAPARIEGNTVNYCDYGVYVSNSATYPLQAMEVLRDTVNMDPAGSGSDGISLRGRFVSTISGNRVRDAGRYGMYFDPDFSPGDSAAATLDSNAVSGSSSYGIYITPGADSVDVVGQYNNITNNLLDGIYSVGTGVRSFTMGSFVGNVRWAVSSSPTFDATQNWWGDPGGAGIPGVSDSVTANVDASSPLLTDPTGVTVPLPSPHFAALGARLLRSSTLGAQESGDHLPVSVDERARRERRAAKELAFQQRAAARDAERERRVQESERVRREHMRGRKVRIRPLSEPR